MAEIAKTVSEDYERGFKDGLKSECLKELKPFMVGIAKGCIEAIKGISPMLIDNAQLTIRHAVTRWIPCSERLPENDAKCLVYFDRRVAMARWYGNYDEQGAWYIISDDVPKLYRIKNVPYWMPLPEPPKEGAENG